MQILNFKTDIPVPIENETRKGSFINWGVNNLYPNWILNLYNDSALHKNIINIKTNKILGEGLFYKEGDEAFKLNANPSYSFNSLMEYIIKDYIIFNFFAIEVTYNKLGEPFEYRHIPAHQLRFNKEKSSFWFCDDWFKNSRNVLSFDRWKKGNPDKTLATKIFYYEKRTPSVSNVYPSPDYSGALKSILIDTEIDNFNLNNIQNHFSPMTSLSIFQDIEDPERKKQYVNTIQKNYSGSDGKKLMIDFVGTNGKAVEVKNISPNEWDKMFEKTVEDVVKKICNSHSINPILAGASSDTNALSQSTELKNAYKIFYQDYINVIRTQIEEALNNLLSERKDYREVELYSQSAFFEDEVSEALQSSVMTINEVREKLGLEPIVGGDVLIGSSLAVTEKPDAATFSKGKTKVELSESDYEKVKDLGIDAAEFEVVDSEDFHVHSLADARELELRFDKESDIADYLINNDVSGKSLSEIKTLIRKDLGIDLTTKDLNSTLKSMNDAGVIKVDITDNKVSISKAPDAPVEDIRQVEVVYEYAKRPEVDGSTLIPNSRPFCVKMVENKRYYTREDIQSMSTIFGYDIFKFAGGFYTDGIETTPYCRHYWKAIKVARKK